MNTIVVSLSTLLFLSLTSLVYAQEKPKLPYHDWNACPFECCTYREWVTTAPLKIFKNRDEKGGMAFELQSGEKVLALTGVVVTRKVGVTEITKPIDVGYLPNGNKRMLSLKPGDVVYTLRYAGEGYDVFWYKSKVYLDQITMPGCTLGEVLNSEAVKVMSRPEYEWWAKIRNKTGQTGWTRETDKFGNKDACSFGSG